MNRPLPSPLSRSQSRNKPIIWAARPRLNVEVVGKFVAFYKVADILIFGENNGARIAVSVAHGSTPFYFWKVSFDLAGADESAERAVTDLLTPQATCDYGGADMKLVGKRMDILN